MRCQTRPLIHCAMHWLNSGRLYRGCWKRPLYLRSSCRCSSRDVLGWSGNGNDFRHRLASWGCCLRRCTLLLMDCGGRAQAPNLIEPFESIALRVDLPFDLK